MASTASTSVARSDRQLLDECTCPICRSILIHPVTLPCEHELCMPCFKQTVQEASLCCPLCRVRISTWARRASREKALVNEQRWKEIQNLFPDRVQRRLNGADEDEDSDEDEEEYIGAQYRHMVQLSKPGEIRQEYEEELNRLMAVEAEERRQEEEASEALIRRLQSAEQEEAEEARRRQEEIAARDEELALRLAETNSPHNDISVAILGNKQDSHKSSVDGPDCMAKVKILENRERKQPDGNDGSKTLETFFRRLPPGVRPAPQSSPTNHTCVSESRLNRWLKDSLSPRSSSVPLGSETDSISDDLPSRRLRSASEDYARPDCQVSKKRLSKARSAIEGPCPPPPACSSSCGESQQVSSLDPVRIDAEPGTDACADASVCFKPIQSSATTPPRKLPAGEQTQPCFVQITPLIKRSFGEKMAGNSKRVKEGEFSRHGHAEHSVGNLKNKPPGQKGENAAQSSDGKRSSKDMVMNRKETVSECTPSGCNSESRGMHSTDNSGQNCSIPSSTASIICESPDHRAQATVTEPSASAGSKPAGIFNPATVPVWSEGLYHEMPASRRTSRPSSPPVKSKHRASHASPSSAKKPNSRKISQDSGKKYPANHDECSARPAKLPKLLNIDFGKHRASSDTANVQNPSIKNICAESAVKDSLPSCSKTASEVLSSTDVTLVTTVKDQHAVGNETLSSPEIYFTSEDPVEGSGKKNLVSRMGEGSHDKSQTNASDDSGRNAKGSQRSIHDWFSPKSNQGYKHAQSAGRASPLGKGKASNRKSRHTSVSHGSSTSSSAISSKLSAQESSLAEKVTKSAGRKLQVECSCCPTETCTSVKLDKYLGTAKPNLSQKPGSVSEKSKGKKGPTASKQRKRKLSFKDSDSNGEYSIPMTNTEENVVEEEEEDHSDSEEELTQEEKDLRLARRLQAQFDLADKLQMNVIRFKGSDNEYSLRQAKHAKQ